MFLVRSTDGIAVEAARNTCTGTGFSASAGAADAEGHQYKS